MKKYLPLASLPALFLAASFAGADTLYWVDATSYFDAAPSGQIDGRNIWDIERDFSSAEKSQYSDNYNWATGYTLQDVTVGDVTYQVPVYEYATPGAVPNENTDVYFDFSEFSNGNSTDGYRHKIGGSPQLSSDVTVKSITISGTRDNWLMIKTNGYDLTVKEDLIWTDTNVVTYIGESSKSNLTVGGTIYLRTGSTSIWNCLRFGYNGVGSIDAGAIKFEQQSRIQLATSGAATTFENPQAIVRGLVDFSGYDGRLDLGRKGNSAEQFYSVGGLSGSNSAATVSTGAEDTSTGINSTLVLANSADATFTGKVTNALVSTDQNSIAIDNTVNVVMNGSATQTLSGDNDFRGYVTIQSGTLLLRTASGASHGKLTLNGGKFGAIGNAAFSSAEWNGGAIGFFNTGEAIAVMTPETVTINGEFAKTGAGKITVDFNNIDTYDLIDNGEWYDLIVADMMGGLFSDDANDDFIAANLSSGYADFQWIDFDGGKILQVSFSSVPEPAAVAAILGALALAAAYRKRR